MVSVKDQSHPSEHAAIIERGLWDKVHKMMASNRRAALPGVRGESKALFKGLVDDPGNRMSPAHANRGGRRYRCYVSQALLQQRKRDAGSLPRLPAHDFDQLVSGRIGEVLTQDARMKAALIELGWNNEQDRQRLLRIIIRRIEVGKGVVLVQFDPAAAFAGQAVGLKPEAKTIEISVVVLNRTGGAEIVGGRQLGDTLRRPNPRRSSAE